MPIIRWDPFREFDRMFHEDWGLVPMLKKNAPFHMPSVDVYQKENSVIAELEVPAGVDPEKVDITVEHDMLYVRGETEEKAEEKEKDYFRREIRRGSFERAIKLPVSVNEDAVSAQFEKGILTITMPKKEEPRGKKVQVSVKK